MKKETAYKIYLWITLILLTIVSIGLTVFAITVNSECGVFAFVAYILTMCYTGVVFNAYKEID